MSDTADADFQGTIAHDLERVHAVVAVLRAAGEGRAERRRRAVRRRRLRQLRLLRRRNRDADDRRANELIMKDREQAVKCLLALPIPEAAKKLRK